MRAILALAVSGLAMSAVALGGCGGNGSSGAGISTASLLDGQAAAGSAEVPRIKNDDPMARPVQVGWTVARAQRCGFNFDAAKLKANFLTSESQRGQQANLANIEKSYDQTFTTISARIKGEDGYCTEKKSAAIKADLQRHLAGNYDPKLPEEKKVAASGLFDGFISDEPQDKFDAKTYWADQEAKRQGAKGAQKVE